MSETEPSRSDTPLEPLRSERLLITKSPALTSLRLSPSLDFAALSNCGKIPFLVTESGGYSTSDAFVLLSKKRVPSLVNSQLAGTSPSQSVSEDTYFSYLGSCANLTISSAPL